MHLPGEHAVNRFKLIIRNIPKARADDSGSDSQVIAAAIGRAINDGNGARPPMQIHRSVGWNSGLVQSAFSSLVNRGHGSFRALNGRKSYGKGIKEWQRLGDMWASRVRAQSVLPLAGRGKTGYVSYKALQGLCTGHLYRPP